MPGQPGSYGRGKIGDERETVEVGGFGKLAGLREKGIKHWLSQSSDTLTGFSVSELEEEGGRTTRGGKEEDEEIETNKQLEKVTKTFCRLSHTFILLVLFVISKLIFDMIFSFHFNTII